MDLVSHAAVVATPVVMRLTFGIYTQLQTCCRSVENQLRILHHWQLAAQRPG